MSGPYDSIQDTFVKDFKW